MRWYVRAANGDTRGPVDDQTVATWARGGHLGPGTVVAPEGGNDWIPIERSSFAVATKRKTKLGTILGIGAALFGSCAVLAGIGANGQHAKSPSSSPSATQKAEAPFVAALVQLAANPKTVKAVTPAKLAAAAREKPGKDVSYEYSDPPGIPVKTLYLDVSKANPAAWEFMFAEEQAPTVHAEDFAPTGGLSKLPSPMEGFENYEITSGPLKGSFLQREGGRYEVTSLPYAIAAGMRWACENRLSGGTTWDSFQDQCRDMVRAKLLVPKSADFPGLFDGTQQERQGMSTPGCGWSWSAWVESKNAFNVEIRHRFSCTFDPKTRMISLNME